MIHYWIQSNCKNKHEGKVMLVEIPRRSLTQILGVFDKLIIKKRVAGVLVRKRSHKK